MLWFIVSKIDHLSLPKHLYWFVFFMIPWPSAYAQFGTDTPLALTPNEPAVLSGSLEYWQAKAQSWYRSTEPSAQRQQMREMSRPLKQSCYYCHTRRFKSYVEENYLISLQMMAISAEQDLSCADCHIGQKGLTELGAKSLIQWRWAFKQGRNCSECHQAQHKFKKLTAKGQASIQELITALEKQLNTSTEAKAESKSVTKVDSQSEFFVPTDVTKNFLKQLQQRKADLETKTTTPQSNQSDSFTPVSPVPSLSLPSSP